MFSIFLMMIPLATAVLEAGGGPGLRQVAAPRQRAVQRRLLAKAAGMRDGPRPGQTGLLLLLWLTAGSLALLRGLASPPSTQSTYGTVETFNPTQNQALTFVLSFCSEPELEDLAMTGCLVWREGGSPAWLAVLVSPLLFGPALASSLQLVCRARAELCCDRSARTRPSKLHAWLSLWAITAVTAVSVTLHSWLVSPTLLQSM